MILHVSDDGHCNYPLSDLLNFYDQIITNPAVLTIVRDPIMQYISWFLYFLGSDLSTDRVSLMETITWYVAKEIVP